MGKNLEELKKVNKVYTDTSAKLDIALCYIVPILEEFEKQITELEKKPTLTLGEIVKKIKRQGFEDPKILEHLKEYHRKKISEGGK